MSAPLTDLSSSISSSGHVDGLGRRLLAFDRETGVMMERLLLRPELSAFESALRKRVEDLAQFEDDRFARPFSVERHPETGELSVLSEYVAGSRLSDLLETAHDAGVVPGVDVALGFLLEALPALSTFHTSIGSAHGLIDPTRMVITPAGQIVFLDCPFGAVIERLGLARGRLWTELGLASAPSAAGRVSLDIPADIGQAALSAVMLVLGRRLREEEYPDALPSLLIEVVDVAQIRGSHLFASGLQRLFQRSLPLPGRRPFSTAIEALEEVRQLLRREIGLTACHQALVDFTEQMEGAASPSEGDEAEEQPFGDEDELTADSAPPQKRLNTIVIDTHALDGFDSIEVLDVIEDSEFVDEGSEDSEFDGESDDPLEVEVSLDQELTAASRQTDVEPPAFETGRTPDSVQVAASEADHEARPPTAAPVSAAEPATDTQADGADQAGSASSRRKRNQHKSARARKDKLRSTTAPPPAPPPKAEPPKAEPARAATPSGWIVSPDRAAKFEPPVAEPSTSAQPVAGQPIAPQPVYAAPPAPPPPPAAAPARPVPMPVFGAPPAVAPPPAPAPVQPAPVQPIQPVQRQPAAAAPLRVKTEPPSGYTPPRTRDSMAALPYVQRGPTFQAEQPRPFPWKLAAAAVLIVAAAIVIGREYIPSRSQPAEDSPIAQAPAPEPPPVAAPAAAATGDISIETQPAGARVLLDGKAVGESPLKLTGIPAGRHVLTFISSSGEVTKTVRVPAGKMVSLDVPIFSGWVAIFAPIVVEVSENGRSLGSTEQNRFMLPPGRHELTFVNRDLGYKAVQEVDVEPGEVRSITIEPKGTVSFNAVPWAEVWLDGQKLGDTPLANMRVALGVREFVFKHPVHGERRISTTVRADQASAVSVDFTRQQ